jgi:hypothetical protein
MNARTLIALAPLVVSGCIAFPTTVEYFDEDCQIMAKRMELDLVELDAIYKCPTESCERELRGRAIVGAVTTVASGSIVAIGNIVYSRQRDKNCKPNQAPALPAPSDSASAAAV